jgi:hypothetical protein
MPASLVHRDAAVAVLAALMLATGYAALWRGGTELAAILLVVAYVVAVPAAILVRRGP